MSERVPDASEKMFQEKVIKLAKAAGLEPVEDDGEEPF